MLICRSLLPQKMGPKHFNIKFTQRKVWKIWYGDYIQKSVEITKKVVEDAKFKISEIDEVILVGGQTRMPKMQEEVKKLFGKEPHKGINPDEVVALGAAIQGEFCRRCSRHIIA